MAVKAPVRKRKRRRNPLPTLIAVLIVLIVVLIGLFAVSAFGHGDAEEPQEEPAATAETSEPAATETAEEEETTATPTITVCLDPGHGGKDPGANAPDGTQEKDDVLNLALAVRDAMEAKGINVIMTREDDTFVELEQRPVIANEAGADYFISFHRNSADIDAKGIELWYSNSASEETVALAERMEAALVAVGVSRDRGAQAGTQSGSGDYAVCRLSEMPAVLIEMGFMNSEEDNQLFNENMTAYADALADAVLEVYEEYHAETEE